MQRLPRYREFSIQPHTPDRYGRTVAEMISDINIGQAMVADGQAFAYRQYLSRCDEKEYLDAEYRVSRHRYGVWQVDGGIRPWDFRSGRNRLAASKSTGTGERWLLSRPKPLPTSSKQTRLARARPNCWRRALGMVTCSLLVIEPVLEAYTVENKHLLPGKTGGAGGQRRINAYFAADGGVELDMPDRRDLPTDLRRRFRIAELYFSGDWGVGLESFNADQERDRYQEAES